jgi:hypothetical protein
LILFADWINLIKSVKKGQNVNNNKNIKSKINAYLYILGLGGIPNYDARVEDGTYLAHQVI